MYLEELIIEGFKSYATRTVISPWDPQFNAITGLNGSGKSNILDALCFVLGLDNLRQVRAVNLADLVYKRGQAGITRASVTAVFNNEDEAASPIGYVEQDKITVTRQIVCGTNKQRFFINGHSVPQKSVDSLFQSVQLNVNHPHFLIMQGQITKVLNMKPAEILAMVEESAGTRMFEDRRQKAHQTLEKKDGKVQEIGGLLREMIEPKLDTLRVQRSDFVEYKRAEADLERLRKLILANDFWNAARTTRHESRILQEGQEEVSELTQKISGWKREAQDLEEEINTIIRKRQKDKNLEQRLKALEQQVVEAEKTQVRQQSRLEIVSQSLKEKAVELKEAKKDLTRIQSGKKVDAKVDTKAFDACRARYEGLKEAVQQDEALLQGLTTGISVQGAAGNYEQLLNEKQQQLSHLQVTLQTGQQRLADLHAEIKSKQPQVNKAKKNVERTYQEWQVVESEIASLVQQLENSEDVEVGDLEKRHQKLKSKLSELNGKSASLRSQVGHLTKFEYSEPYGGFDHSKVKGIVADLITLKDAQCSTAIEVAAGGRLFNVVVADDATGKDILEKGKLSRRVTIIPLNKISSRPIPTDKQRLAAEMTDGNAQVALSLVGSPRELSAAMEYVFGGTFVCKDKASAERVAFDKALGVRAVTLDGDVYEPSGTLTGGSAPANAGLLDRLFAYKALQSDIRSIETELSDVEKALLGAKTTKNEVEKARKTVEMKKHQLSSQRDAFAKSSGGLLITSFEATEKELQELSCILPQLQERIKDLESQVAKIEKDSNEFGKDRNGKIKELRLRLENNQAQLAKAEMEYNVMQRNVNSAQVEKEHFSNTLKNMQNSINDLEKELDELKKEGEELESGLESNTAASLRTEYERERIQFAQNDSQVKQLEARKSVLSENVDKAQLAITQSQQQLEKSQTNLSKAEEALKALGQKYPWLKDQQRYKAIVFNVF